eukprot:TRINITY_DN59444_c0_g1_i1.p1 TRINITY_DN59444_c0_g1~~TRINITY_DN59444_c0_g1_i1.p1  ORF type:complete len:185 (-),score=3.98 TRINITY_DN59444_c0_g1_i1:635-1135(-)
MDKPTAPYKNITPVENEILVTVHGYGPPRKCWVSFGTTAEELVVHYFSRWWHSGIQLMVNGQPLPTDFVFTEDTVVSLKRKPLLSWDMISRRAGKYQSMLVGGAKLGLACAFGCWLAGGSHSSDRKLGICIGTLLWMWDRSICKQPKVLCNCEEKHGYPSALKGPC